MTDCSLCKSLSIEFIDKINNYKLYHCLNCDVIFLNPQPSNREIDNNNLSFYESIESENAYFKMKEEMFRRAEKCVQILKKYSENGTLLDIGCSYGFYLTIFKKRGYKTFGIDISEKALNYAKKTLKLSVKRGKIDNFSVKGKKYDIITLFDVIEHLANPKKTISKISQMLKKDGIIVIQTPNYPSIVSRLTREKWFWLLIPQHLFLYSTRSLKFLLANNGFSVIDMYSWDDINEFANNILFLFKIKNVEITKLLYKSFHKPLFLTVTFLSSFWSKFNYGGEIVIYAKKS